MAFALGKASLKELEGVHPALIDIVKRAIGISSQDFSVHDGLRTLEEQRRYVQTGVSKTMNSMHRQQADGLGHAVDLVPYINGKLRWEWPAIYPIAAAMRIAVEEHNKCLKAGEKPLAIRWGGIWADLMTVAADPLSMNKAVQAYVASRQKAGKSAFIDGPHFEII
jgi:peptidoglycan L-alanyl-D-glutamate endopeptidase CwlK